MGIEIVDLIYEINGEGCLGDFLWSNCDVSKREKEIFRMDRSNILLGNITYTKTKDLLYEENGDLKFAMRYQKEIR